MFWLAAITACLMLLHGLILFVLKWKKKNSEKQGSYGSLVFPRFEIFLLILALPSVCEASTALIRGGSISGVIVGILLLGFVSFLLLALFISFQSELHLVSYSNIRKYTKKAKIFIGIEVSYVTLGPGKRGQWTWKKQPNSVYLTMFGPLFEDLRGPPMYMLSQISLGKPPKQGDTIITFEDETEDAEAPFIQKVFGIMRIYYTLIECVKRVSLEIIAGLFSENQTSIIPTVMLLAITSFQLFFLVLKKLFIKKKVQLAEIISVSSEVGIFATFYVILRKEFSVADETKIDILMISLFLFAFLAQMVNEWYVLYSQTKQLDPLGKSFYTGTKIFFIGILMFFAPRKWTKTLESKVFSKQRIDEPRDPLSSGDRQRSSESKKNSGTSDNQWLKQLRKMAKASFSKESGTSSNPFDPSPSKPRWSGFWNTKRSGSSSQKSFADYRGRPSRLYKDLENIFASNK